jgi:hypothetical protein
MIFPLASPFLAKRPRPGRPGYHLRRKPLAQAGEVKVSGSGAESEFTEVPANL